MTLKIFVFDEIKLNTSKPKLPSITFVLELFSVFKKSIEVIPNLLARPPTFHFSLLFRGSFTPRLSFFASAFN